jgi:hypothetical protein
VTQKIEKRLKLWDLAKFPGNAEVPFGFFSLLTLKSERGDTYLKKDLYKKGSGHISSESS